MGLETSLVFIGSSVYSSDISSIQESAVIKKTHLIITSVVVAQRELQVKNTLMWWLMNIHTAE